MRNTSSIDKLEKRSQTCLHARFPAFEIRTQSDGIEQCIFSLQYKQVITTNITM